MDSYLLATKLHIPPQPHHTVSRARLTEVLEQNLPRYKLTLLSAPAGYGKTTLLSQWAHESRFKIAWLSISEEDNDFGRFFRYLLRGWSELQPGIKESPLGLLLSGMSPNSEAVLAAFINAANDVSEHTVFVLDDYHLIEEPTIHEALTFLLEHLPAKVHFVLASRAEPPLPLARYRARHELLEFRSEDLHFSPEETEDFLVHRMGLELSPEEIKPLHTQLEGWVAGLQLVSLTFQRQREAADKLSDTKFAVNKFAITGRHRFVADYLSQDVLAHLPAEVRQFLLETSILAELCGSLCDAVTGAEGSQAMLERLERDNVFLLPLDDRREWFRYHRLFADFLREEFQRQQPHEVVQCHRRAARWYLTHDLPDQALHHAVAGDDAELGREIAERYFEVKLLSGELKLLKRWLESLPEAWLSYYPAFNLFRAGVFLFTGAFAEGIRCIDEVERVLALTEHEDKRWQLAQVAATRCSVECFQNNLALAESYAESALTDLPAEDHSFRAIIHHSLGDTYRRNGRWQEAREHYLNVLELSGASAFRIRSVHVLGGLADVELRQGSLRNAAAYWQKAFTALEQATPENFPLPLIGWLYLRMAEILYQWDDLEEASHYLSQGLERAELGGDMRVLLTGYLLAGRLKLTSGDLGEAVAYLERVRPLVEKAQFSDRKGQAERFQVELWLAQNNLRDAFTWADEKLQDDGLEEQAETRLAMARVLIAKEDESSLERALALLRQTHETAEAEGRMGLCLEALTLLALAHWRRTDRTGAMTSLERALRLAEPEGYVRLLADLGLSMARLLQEARSVLPEYVEKLLTAFRSTPTSSTTKALPEPLTPREQEVLNLLAAGLMNREIAKHLSVASETVKKHVGNIYTKLGVSNRTAAAARARELDLLE